MDYFFNSYVFVVYNLLHKLQPECTGQFFIFFYETYEFIFVSVVISVPAHSKKTITKTIVNI